ncbi:MAG: glutamate racemase [Chloroflexi bacterium]|nr:glutamate racemase [Chloroflexota bacterium]
MSTAMKQPAHKDNPIGVFDSGIGGLSVLRALRIRLPNEDFLYIADSLNCPYGSRSAQEIATLSRGIARYLIERGVKLIVVACNTASAAALADLRQAFSVPFVGMVPAVKPAVGLTQTGVVGVLATPMTFEGWLYHEVVEHYAGGVRVISSTCDGLVERIEAGDLDGPQTQALLRTCLRPILEAGADTLVLGCTHYPFVEGIIRRIVGPAVRILEPSAAVAEQAARVLDREGLRRLAGEEGTVRFATTGSPQQFAAALKAALGLQAPVAHLVWGDNCLQDDPMA